MTRQIYLDNSATTRPYDEVADVVNVFLREKYGNPSSLHFKGLEVERDIKNAREIVASSLGAAPGEIYFTSGGTEANNIAIRGYIEGNSRKGRHIITTSIEHPSILNIFKHLDEMGYQVDYLKVDKNGIINLDELAGLVREDTLLVSIMNVNNETGSIQPVEKAVSTVRSRNMNTAFHVDAVQAYGKIPVQPAKSGIDLLTVSGHKIHGPKGVGAMFVKKGIRLKPIIFGGGQESAIRSGTENVPGICGFGKAVEMTFRDLEKKCSDIRGLRNILHKEIEEKIPGCVFNTPISLENGTAPHILNVSFPGIRAEVLLHSLEAEGIYVSTGSACSSRKKVYSHVLKAMGLENKVMEGAIRFSLSIYNTEEEINRTIGVLKNITEKLVVRTRR